MRQRERKEKKVNIVRTELSLSHEDRKRIGETLEICDDQTLVNRKLLEKGLLSVTTGAGPDEFRYIPFVDGEWIYLACMAPVDVAGPSCKTVIMRIPASWGEKGRIFFVGFMAKQAGEYADDGTLEIRSHDCSGKNN